MQTQYVVAIVNNFVPHIRGALRSVEEAVTYPRGCEGVASPPVELILVDDGSPGMIPQEIAAFVGPHGPWKLVRHDGHYCLRYFLSERIIDRE
jgi:hypothetical protein